MCLRISSRDVHADIEVRKICCAASYCEKLVPAADSITWPDSGYMIESHVRFA